MCMHADAFACVGKTCAAAPPTACCVVGVRTCMMCICMRGACMRIRAHVCSCAYCMRIVVVFVPAAPASSKLQTPTPQSIARACRHRRPSPARRSRRPPPALGAGMEPLTWTTSLAREWVCVLWLYVFHNSAVASNIYAPPQDAGEMHMHAITARCFTSHLPLNPFPTAAAAPPAGPPCRRPARPPARRSP